MQSIFNPTITIPYVSELELGLQLDVTTNFDITNNLRRQCPSGYRKRYLRPEERCSDQFTIGTCKKLKKIDNARISIITKKYGYNTFLNNYSVHSPF